MSRSQARRDSDDEHLIKGGHKVKRIPLIHSRCVQVHVNDVVGNAMSILSSKSEAGEIPLVLIPTARWTGALFLQIPSGVSCLIQKFGKDMGESLSPGLHLLPAYYKIAYIVSKQACCYDAPVASCPTADDVRVSVDCTVRFQIVDAQKFVYRLGAQNFDEFLSATVDESIRMLVRQETHKSVYSLRGERADIMLKMLNDKFVEAGVQFDDVKVTSVWLPDRLANALEITTKLAKGMEKAMTENEFEILQIKQDSEMQIEEIKRRQEQTLVTEAGKKRRAELEKEQRNVKAEEEGSVAMLLAQGKVEVDKLQTNTDLARTKMRLETWRVKEMAEAESRAQAKKIGADLEEEKAILAAGWQEEKMLMDAEITKLDAGLEAEAIKNLAAKRQFDMMMREKGILKQLASKGSFNLVGTPGDRLVNAVLTGTLGAQA